jgi:hypothetical protein
MNKHRNIRRHLRRSLKLIASLLLATHKLAHADLTSGLVASYPFNGNANDASGNNGTVYGATLTANNLSTIK